MYGFIGGAVDSMIADDNHRSFDWNAAKPKTDTDKATENTGTAATPTPVAPPVSKPVASSPVYSADYKERMQQIKQRGAQSITDAKVRAIKEIKNGAGDEIADGARNALSKVLLAPYEVLNYTIISVMSLIPKDRLKFVLIGVGVTVVCIVLFVLLWLLTDNTRYLVDVLGCIVALLTLFLCKGLSLSSSVDLGELQEPDDMYL
ncbi:MAG: hypothetical protein RSC43_00880 [Clostridia bacterium]